MQLKINPTLLILVLLWSSITVQAQYRRKTFDIFEGFKIAPTAGVNIFFGDLVDNSRTSYSFGVAAEREMLPYLNARTSFMLGQMKGTQIQYIGNLPYAYFRNKYFDVNIGATFKPLDLAFGYYKQRSFNPYIVGQLGIIAASGTEWYGIGSGNADGTVWRDFSAVHPIITLGAGVSYWFSNQLSLRAEALPTYVFGDQVDGHEYYERGDGSLIYTDSNDFYYTFTAGISYTIKDSRWKNEPKYNRKAYLKTRKYTLIKPSKRTNYRPKRKR